MIYQGNFHLGELLKSRRARGREGLAVLSVTMDAGLIERVSLDRKQETTLLPEDHLSVEPGDIAYNMMRMWQGAFGLAKTEGMVSPAYVVLRTTKKIDPLFASYLLETPRLRYLLWAYSYGMTDDRLRLYYADFAKIPASIPSLSKQRLIGACIETWDAAISITESLIENSKHQKTALVEQLISPDKNPRSGRWVEKRIKQVAQVIVSSVNKKAVAGERHVRLCNYTDVYKNDHITSDIDFMEATASESEIARFALRKGDVVLTKDSEAPDDIGVPACVAEDIPGLICGYHLAIVRPNLNETDPEFLTGLFLLRKTRKYFQSESNGATRFGLPVSALENATFLLPTLSEQRRIAQALTRNTHEIALLSRQLELLRAERRFLLTTLIPQRTRAATRLSADFA
jgi:type I restriction enzyme S subunit